ncbi:MAG: hypothetical protein ACRD5H_11725 [Nitrososphaerales archaeon]
MASNHERSDQMGLLQIEASSKLDYFILGVTLAICAYLAQTNPYAPVGINKETFLLISLAVFAGSAVCGFKRLEAKVSIMHSNAQALGAATEHEHDEYCDRASKYNKKAIFHYSARNGLLLIGLICYIGTKVWASYQSNGWIPVS